MSKTVDELESGVARLSEAELDQFSAWFEDYLADKWDRQIEADIRSGRLDQAGKQADKDFEDGRCTPF